MCWCDLGVGVGCYSCIADGTRGEGGAQHCWCNLGVGGGGDQCAGVGKGVVTGVLLMGSGEGGGGVHHC